MTRISRKQQPLLCDRRTTHQSRSNATLRFAIYCFIAVPLLASVVVSLTFLWNKMRTRHNVVGYTWKELVGSNEAITCQDALRRVTRGIWIDPNEGKSYYRRSLVTEPSFAISLHSESYDPVRWEHIYVKGKYYEDRVHARFLKILGNNEHPPSNDGEAASEIEHALPISLVVDIGANIGYYTLLSMSLGYSALSFEINPPNILRMCESLVLNNWILPENDENNHRNQPMVRFYQQGVSDIDGETLQVVVPRNAGQAYMLKEGDEGGEAEVLVSEEEQSEEYSVEDWDKFNRGRGKQVQTTTVTMDGFAERHGWLIPINDGSFAINPNVIIKILKIDVEGKEAHVVEGTQALLRSGIIENVLIEFRRLGRPNVQQAMLVLLDSGYTLIDDEEGKVSITRATEILSTLTDLLRGTRKTVDLWFQRVDY